MLGSMASSLFSVFVERFWTILCNDLIYFNIVTLSFSPKSPIILVYVVMALLILLTASSKSGDGWTILLPTLTINRVRID